MNVSVTKAALLVSAPLYCALCCLCLSPHALQYVGAALLSILYRFALG